MKLFREYVTKQSKERLLTTAAENKTGVLLGRIPYDSDYDDNEFLFISFCHLTTNELSRELLQQMKCLQLYE